MRNCGGYQNPLLELYIIYIKFIHAATGARIRKEIAAVAFFPLFNLLPPFRLRSSRKRRFVII